MPTRFTNSASLFLEPASRVCIAVALIGFGVQQFHFTGDLAGIELLPPWLLTHASSAWPVGILLIAGAINIALTRRARVVSIVLAFLFLVSLLLFDQSSFAQMGQDIGQRTRVFEMITISAGFLILAASLPAGNWSSDRAHSAIRIAGLVGRLCFAVSMAVFGWSHIVIPKFIASLIPAWMPAHLFFAYFTACVFFAAALALVTGFLLRPASFALGLMLFLWVITLHAPRVAAAMHNRDEWNSLFVALIISGFSFVLAASPTCAKASALSFPDELYAEDPGPQRVA
jgi:uncharacterized membrane protein YphA (DoxX/SURF4 family)